MNFDVSLRNLFALTMLATAILDLILGGLVLADSPRRKVNRSFSILSLALSVWGISFVGLNYCADAFFLTLWSKFYIASLLFVPPLFYSLVLGNIGNPNKGHDSALPNFHDRLKQLAYVFSCGWLVLMTSGVVQAHIVKNGSFAFPEIGAQFWVAASAYLGLFSTAFWLLGRQIYGSKDPAQKNRLMYMTAGGVAIVAGGMLAVVLAHMTDFRISWPVPLGHVVSTLCLVLIAYSLTTSHLYHFSELLRKTLAFIVMTAILIFVFGGTHFLSRQLLLPYIPRSDYFALGMASIIMALLFHPLRFRVQNLVDRMFFTQRYDQMQRLRGLSRRVLSSADREELLHVFFSSLRAIGFSSITLLLKDPQKPLFHIKKHIGLKNNSEGFFLRSDSLLIQHLREEKAEVIRDEVVRRILTDWERESISDEMDILQSEICFPLFSTRRRALFGVITLGNSDLGYSSYKGRNIFWLKSVIDNAGIMLDNFYHQEFASALVPYVGRTWASEMRRNKEGFRERLAGHRTWVSVLMVDIRHFTPLSARLDPSEVVELLQEFRLRIAPIVYRHQGTIDKFIGDAIMIVFGLPILPLLKNPDKNAVECALDIMKEIEAMNPKVFRSGRKERISIGIGVSSGDVIAGNVDSGDRVEYTVIGDAANMVARLEDMAGDNQILISAATHEKVKESVITNALPARAVQGFHEPIVVYELIANNPAASESGFGGRLAANQ